MCYSASNYLCIFCCCFCCWVLVSVYCDEIEFRVLFLFSYICWGFLCALRYDLFRRNFPWLLRRMYIVLLLGEIFCSYQLDPFDLWCHLALGFADLFGWPIFWWYRGIKVSHYQKAFKPFGVCLMKLGALTLGAHSLIIVISFWCHAPFVSMKCPYLSCLTNVTLKSTSSDISIATPACYQGPLAW
jgi:hypothetical protein